LFFGKLVPNPSCVPNLKLLASTVAEKSTGASTRGLGGSGPPQILAKGVKGGRCAFGQRIPIALIITDMVLYVVVCFKLTAAIRDDIGSRLMVAATDKAADKVWVTSHGVPVLPIINTPACKLRSCLASHPYLNDDPMHRVTVTRFGPEETRGN